MSQSVLHIEDRRENRILVRKLLEARGYEVTDAVDGLTGLELARRGPWVLVLIDIDIPKLDGYEVVTCLRDEATLADTPLIAITAEGDRDRALALGFDGFMTKPIQMTRFVDQLEGFIAGERETISEADCVRHQAAHGREVVSHLEARVRELTTANERLREVDRLKMEVLRNVSHELSTPLTPLVGYVNMLMRGELGPLSELQLGVVAQMDRSVTRLSRQITNLLNVTRFEQARGALARGVVEPAEIVRRAVDAATAGQGPKPAQLVVGAIPEESMLADVGALVEALRQLIDNAHKFGPKEGLIQIEVRRLLGAHGDERIMEFSVSDTGPGIPLHARADVVRPFFQLDGSVTRRQGGTGLGLAIAQRTAEMHGGALSIGRTVDGGARLALKVPCRPLDVEP